MKICDFVQMRKSINSCEFCVINVDIFALISVTPMQLKLNDGDYFIIYIKLLIVAPIHGYSENTTFACAMHQRRR